MAKYLLIRVATENDFIVAWPEVAIVKLSEKFIGNVKAIREVVVQHDMLRAEYDRSHVWPIYWSLTDVPESEPWNRLETEGYLVVETDETFEMSEDFIVELETLSVTKSSFCFKGSVDDQAFETWDVPFEFIEAHDDVSGS